MKALFPSDRHKKRNTTIHFRNGMTLWVLGAHNKTNLQRRSIRWLIGASRSKAGKPMFMRLADELMAAFRREGEAMAKRENTYKGSLPLVVYGAVTAAIIAVITLVHGALVYIPTFLWSVGLIPYVDPEIYRMFPNLQERRTSQGTPRRSGEPCHPTRSGRPSTSISTVSARSGSSRTGSGTR